MMTYDTTSGRIWREFQTDVIASRKLLLYCRRLDMLEPPAPSMITSLIAAGEVLLPLAGFLLCFQDGRAALAAAHNPAEAIRVLQSLPRSDAASDLRLCLLEGEAELAAHRPARALRCFEAVLSRQSLLLPQIGSPFVPLPLGALLCHAPLVVTLHPQSCVARYRRLCHQFWQRAGFWLACICYEARVSVPLVPYMCLLAQPLALSFRRWTDSGACRC
jgi:hypothetical protein